MKVCVIRPPYSYDYKDMAKNFETLLGVLVSIHDPCLDRVCNGSKACEIVKSHDPTRRAPIAPWASTRS